jgi:hypothetical protein
MAGGMLQGHTKMHGPSMFALSPHSSSFPHKDDDTISDHNLISIYIYILRAAEGIFLLVNAFK